MDISCVFEIKVFESMHIAENITANSKGPDQTASV